MLKKVVCLEILYHLGTHIMENTGSVWDPHSVSCGHQSHMSTGFPGFPYTQNLIINGCNMYREGASAIPIILFSIP